MNKKFIIYTSVSVLMILIIYVYAAYFSGSRYIQSWAEIGRFIFIYLAAVTPVIAILWLTIQKTSSLWQRRVGWLIIAILCIGGVVSYAWKGTALVNECTSQGGILSQTGKRTSFNFKCIEIDTHKMLPLTN